MIRCPVCNQETPANLPGCVHCGHVRVASGAVAASQPAAKRSAPRSLLPTAAAVAPDAAAVPLAAPELPANSSPLVVPTGHSFLRPATAIKASDAVSTPELEARSEASLLVAPLLPLEPVSATPAVPIVVPVVDQAVEAAESVLPAPPVIPVAPVPSVEARPDIAFSRPPKAAAVQLPAAPAASPPAFVPQDAPVTDEKGQSGRRFSGTKAALYSAGLCLALAIGAVVGRLPLSHQTSSNDGIAVQPTATAPAIAATAGPTRPTQIVALPTVAPTRAAPRFIVAHPAPTVPVATVVATPELTPTPAATADDFFAGTTPQGTAAAVSGTYITPEFSITPPAGFVLTQKGNLGAHSYLAHRTIWVDPDGARILVEEDPASDMRSVKDSQDGYIEQLERVYPTKFHLVSRGTDSLAGYQADDFRFTLVRKDGGTYYDVDFGFDTAQRRFAVLIDIPAAQYPAKSGALLAAAHTLQTRP